MHCGHFHPTVGAWRARAPILLVGKVKKALGLKYANYHSDFYKRKCPFFGFPHPHWEKLLILLISCPQQNILLLPCYYGSIDNKKTSYTKLKVDRNKKWDQVCTFSLFGIIRFKYQFRSKVLPTKQLSP